MIINTNHKAFFWPVLLSCSLLVLGAVFKLEHWPFGTEMIIIGSCLVTIFYGFRFLRKVEKEALDIVKLLFVIGYCLKSIFGILHLAGFDIIKTIYTIVLILLVVLLLIDFIKGK